MNEYIIISMFVVACLIPLGAMAWVVHKVITMVTDK